METSKNIESQKAGKDYSVMPISNKCPAELDIHCDMHNAFEVPDDEKALITKDEQTRIKKIRDLGVFSPVHGMANIKNALAGKFYAWIYEDPNGTRFIEYCERYSNRSYSPVMRVEQADIRIAARFQFISRNITERKIRNRVENFIVRAFDEYEGKFRGAQEDEFDIVDILKTLIDVLPKLPICSSESDVQEKETFYWDVVHYAKETYSGSFYEHKSYFALMDEDVQRIAKELGMQKKNLLLKLKRFGFLYLTPSSKGFQTNVRFKGQNGTFTEWAYCIFKLNFFAGVEEIKEPPLVF